MSDRDECKRPGGRSCVEYEDCVTPGLCARWVRLSPAASTSASSPASPAEASTGAVIAGDQVEQLLAGDDQVELVDDGSVCSMRPRGCSKGARVARRKCQGPGRPRRQLGLLECTA